MDKERRPSKKNSKRENKKHPYKSRIRNFFEEEINGSIFWNYNPAKGL